MKVNLLNFDAEHMRQYFIQLGEKPFRAEQVIQWIHQYGYTDFDKMTNLSKALRGHLAEHAVVALPHIARERVSQDGTRKWLMQFADGQCVETVLIPEADRNTLCVSAQTGCAMGCVFCATGNQGAGRNLNVAEIIGQLWLVVRALSDDAGRRDRKISNVVIMGMGEPLLNLEAVVQATNLMMNDFAYGLSKYRVTVSTVGIVPAMEKLSRMSEVSLAVSLHAPSDALRDQLVPINKQYPLKMLMDACKRYFSGKSKRRIAFEYVMLKDINDQTKHAKALVQLVQGIPCKINLIPFNASPQVPYQSSDAETIAAFQRILVRAGLTTIVRKTRGADIAAACGQLKAESVFD